MRGFCIELGILGHAPVQLYCDNKRAIQLARYASFSARTKHIDVRHFFIKEKIDNCEISVQFVPTNKQVADMLTKRVSKEIVQMCQKGMGLLPLDQINKCSSQDV